MQTCCKWALFLLTRAMGQNEKSRISYASKETIFQQWYYHDNSFLQLAVLYLEASEIVDPIDEWNTKVPGYVISNSD